MNHSLSYLLAVCLLTSPVVVQAQQAEAPADNADSRALPVVVALPETAETRAVITDQPDGWTPIVDRRRVTLPAGRSWVHFAYLAGGRDEQTMQLVARDGGAVQVLEQRSASSPAAGFDLSAYIGQQISIQRGETTVAGKLLGYNPTLLETDKGVLLNPEGTWILPRVAASVTNKPPSTPGVQWLLSSAGGPVTLEVHYRTKGLSRAFSYRATVQPGGERLDFEGVASIVNQDGQLWWRGAQWTTPIFGPQTLSGPRPIDLNPTDQRRVVWVSASGLPLQRDIVYRAATWGQSSSDSPLVTARLSNSAAAGLGRSLPEGSLAVWGESAQGEPTVLYEGILQNTAPDGAIALPLGRVRGVGVERIVKGPRRLNPETQTYDIGLQLKNETDAAISMTVYEDLPLAAEVTESAPAASKTERPLQWRVELPAHGASSINYTVNIKTE